MSDGKITAKVVGSVSSVPQAEWDALAGADNPFVSHAFLTALEDSQSVGPETGWVPAPILLEDSEGRLKGAMPSYLKAHSQGEYVFDHHWADAWERAGGDYYPKLQIAAPFTPATGPRLLVADKRYGAPLLKAAENLCAQQGLSSAHTSFVEPDQAAMFEEGGWLRRHDIQFHWRNRDFSSFDDFLGSLASRKRKNLKKERAAAQDGVIIRALTGDDIKPHHWDDFWEFYQDTGARKRGAPYLTRAAFELFSGRMSEKIILLLAEMDGQVIAGALNFVGGQALYGRYWGCRVDKPFLHFELCYYQAIDLAIERGLGRVEAGAQGGHKLARGYEPVETISMHYIADTGFRAAVDGFLQQEREGIASSAMHLGEHTPFKQA